MKAKFVLPFAVSAGDRIKAFTKNMEMAAVLYMAEAARKKGGGHILKRPDEKLVFVAEAHYPVWLVPWSRRTFLIDGCGASAHTLSYYKLPDVRAFNKDIRGGTRTSHAYSAALTRNAGHFKSFAGREERTIKGLIVSPDFIQDFSVYLSDAEETEKPLTRKAVLSRIINEPEIAASLAELSDLREEIRDDVKGIDSSIRLLRTMTRERVKAAGEEIKQIRKDSNKRIKKVRHVVKRRTQRIKKKHQKKIATISARSKRQLRHLHKDQIKLGRFWKHSRVEVNRFETKIESCRRRKNKRSEIRWTRRLRRMKKRLRTLRKCIKDTDKKIKKTEAARNLEVSQHVLERNARVDKAKRIITDLKASLEVNVKMKKQEIASIEDKSSLIASQMRELAKSKRATLNEFDKIAMPMRKRECALVYLPFYLARYEREGRNRYVVYPPSIVSGMGIMTKMKGALGAAKMKAFLQPRSKAITLFLNRLVTLIQKNPRLERELTHALIQDSILGIKKQRLRVRRGLTELKKEEWISKNELQTLGKLLYIYA